SLKTISICISFILGMFLSTQLVLAQGNIHFGRMNVKPQVGAVLEHNNNIFAESKDEIEDVILTIKPKIKFEHLSQRPGNYFQAGYDLEFASYFKKNDNNYQKHQPYLTMGFKTPAGFFAQFSERFMKTADPLGAENSYGFGKRTQRSEYTMDLTFGYEFWDRYTVKTMLQNYALRYFDTYDYWQDRTDNIFKLSFDMRVTPSGKTKVSAEYRFTDATYDRQKVSKSQDHHLGDFLVGFEFEPGGKLIGSAKLGYGSKAFDNSIDDKNRSYEDNNTWLIETNIQFKFSEITKLGFQFTRSIEGAPDRDAASYVDTTIGFDLDHQVKHKTFFKSGLNWTNLDYRDEIPGVPNKYFNFYYLYFGLDYNIQDWLTTGFTYSYETKTASHSTWYNSEYTVNKLIVKVNAMF
ncbi:conserved hypothetical protein, secreted, partial [Candidatus Magnetomorum sp. HK-1]